MWGSPCFVGLERSMAKNVRPCYTHTVLGLCMQTVKQLLHSQGSALKSKSSRPCRQGERHEVSSGPLQLVQQQGTFLSMPVSRITFNSEMQAWLSVPLGGRVERQVKSLLLRQRMRIALWSKIYACRDKASQRRYPEQLLSEYRGQIIDHMQAHHD